MIASDPAESPRRAAIENFAAPDQVPRFDLVPVFGPDGGKLAQYRGVRRSDTGAVVSVVSHRYGLLPHHQVAEAVHAIGEALDKPSPEQGAPAFPREKITLFSGGRRMEIRLVVGTRYELARGETCYPGVRVLNSLDGTVALRCEGVGVRVACANQLVGGLDSLVELREVHLSSATDLLGMLQRAIHGILDKFRDATRLYETAMGEEVLSGDVEPALVAAGLPLCYASEIGARAEVAATHNSLLSRWFAYNLATSAITHEIAPRVSPSRSREFERAAASALLLPAQEGLHA
ncbi:MAG: DUF932 domain-containing protein [Euryarchaeota archaeon]|nr:DUF932 domain-containing protein [Euryarchaeota archaeon]MDE1837432.1 DUF932 domain-containing protein [Euryarchaeota archaeon]MDE2045602.1 DUF932 domain-containing protein [Thermoplasmata archaeon]